MNTQQKLKISFENQVAQFYTTQTTFAISSESNDHSKRWSGEFTSDLIQQLSNDLIETVEDLMDYIISNQKEDIFSMNEEGLKIVFKYVINKKEKVKEIRFPLSVQSIDDITAIKTENTELKQKIFNLNTQMQNLKIQSEQKINALSKQVENLKISYDSRINEANSNIESKLAKEISILRSQYNEKIINLDRKIDNKNSFGDISVREIKFNNGWVLGYNNTKKYFGFVCNPVGQKGYWMTQTAEQKYL